MHIVHIAAGTGHFVCGTCVRDDAFVSALRRQGHRVDVATLYLPLHRQDGLRGDEPIFLGALNALLQHKSRLFRRTPRWFDRPLDHPRLLRWISRASELTRARSLGSMTVSVLKGIDGNQAKEVQRLVRWVEDIGPPDVVVLSNALLSGLGVAIEKLTSCPVVCTFQGEQGFLDALPEPHRSEAWDLLGDAVGRMSGLVAVSRSDARALGERLSSANIDVVHNGIDPSDIRPSGHRPERPTVGYLAAMTSDKGLDVLIEAFVRLRRRMDVDLRVAGTASFADRSFLNAARRRLRREGLEGSVEFLPNIDWDEKVEFLGTLTVLSVPAVYPESFGLYLLEAWAAGVPVVQPRQASFPELLEISGGGLLFDAAEPDSLSEALERVLSDEALATRLGENGRRAVEGPFHIDRAARDLGQVLAAVRA